MRERLIHVRANDDFANLPRLKRRVARRRVHLKGGLAVPRERAELRGHGTVVTREDASVRVAQHADFAEPNAETVRSFGSAIARRDERRRGDVAGQRVAERLRVRRLRGKFVHRGVEVLKKTHERSARGGFQRHLGRGSLRPDAHHRERHADDAQVVRAKGHNHLRLGHRGERPRIGRRRPARQLRRERVLRRDGELRGHARGVAHRHDARLLVLEEHLTERQRLRRRRQLRHSALRAEGQTSHRVADAGYVQQNLLDVPPLLTRHELRLDALLAEGQDRARAGEQRELRPGLVRARHAQREPHGNLARVFERERFRHPEPQRGDSEIQPGGRVDVRERELRADDAPAKVQVRVALAALHEKLERLVERAERLAAQSHGDRARLADAERAARRLERKHAPGVGLFAAVVAAVLELALDLAAVHELHLVLVHGAHEHVANLQRVVVEHRERTHRLPPKRERKPILPPLDVHETRRERLPRVVRVERHRHLELAPGLNLAPQRRHRERGVLEEERVRAERAIQTFAPRRKRHSLGAEYVVLVRRVVRRAGRSVVVQMKRRSSVVESLAVEPSRRIAGG